MQRFAVTGALDAGFGQGGTVEQAHDSGAVDLELVADAPAHAIVRDPRGGYLVAVGRDAIARLTPNGRLDPAFGSCGLAADGAGLAPVTALALQPTGRLLALGEKPTTNTPVMQLAALRRPARVSRRRAPTLAAFTTLDDPTSIGFPVLIASRLPFRVRSPQSGRMTITVFNADRPSPGLPHVLARGTGHFTSCTTTGTIKVRLARGVRRRLQQLYSAGDGLGLTVRVRLANRYGHATFQRSGDLY